MGPPGGGRNNISSRMVRHMNIVAIDSFNDDTLQKIFTTIVDWHFGKGFDGAFSRLGKVGKILQGKTSVLKKFQLFVITTLDDLPEISGKDLARIAHIREEYLQESYKNGVILQVQITLQVSWTHLKMKCLIYLTDNCKKIEQMRSLLHESSKILHFLHFLQDFWSCKKFPRILKVLPDRLTREPHSRDAYTSSSKWLTFRVSGELDEDGIPKWFIRNIFFAQIKKTHVNNPGKFNSNTYWTTMVIYSRLNIDDENCAKTELNWNLRFWNKKFF